MSSPEGPPGDATSNEFASITAVRDPTDVIGRRVGAFMIDLVIVTIVSAAVIVPFVMRRTAAEALALPECHARTSEPPIGVKCDGHMTFQSGNNVTEINIVSVAAAAVLVLAYVGIYQGLTGRTVGKRVTGLRVINRDGSVINVRRSLLRFFSLVVVDVGASAFMVGLATCLATRGHRRVGDMWARTFVVTERAVGHPIFLPPRLEAAYWDSERGAHMRWDMFAGRYLMWDPTSGTWT